MREREREREREILCRGSYIALEELLRRERERDRGMGLMDLMERERDIKGRWIAFELNCELYCECC